MFQGGSGVVVLRQDWRPDSSFQFEPFSWDQS